MQKISDSSFQLIGTGHCFPFSRKMEMSKLVFVELEQHPSAGFPPQQKFPGLLQL